MQYVLADRVVMSNAEQIAICLYRRYGYREAMTSVIDSLLSAASKEKLVTELSFIRRRHEVRAWNRGRVLVA
jgi:hypothetical protein